MRNIIVVGAPRSGKSILARRLSAALGFSHIPADAVVAAFGAILPEHGIRRSGLPHAEICRSFRPFLIEFLRQLDAQGLRYVFDCCHLLPEDAARYVDLGRYAVIFLGYPDQNAEEKLKEIRHHDGPSDWTVAISDRELLANVLDYITQSRELRRGCLNYGSSKGQSRRPSAGV
jgi:predicted kinase